MRRRFMLISIALLLFSSLLIKPIYAVSIDELGKTVVFLRERTQATEQKGDKVVEIWHRDPDTQKFEPKVVNTTSGTGVIIKYNNRDYLVTAKHVIASMSPKAEIIMNLSDGKSMSLTFEWLSKQKIIQGAKWFHHPTADISIHPLCYPAQSDQKSVGEDFFQKEGANLQLLSPAYVLGFPLGLGVHEKLSPLAKKTQIASRLTSVDNPNISPELQFILLDQALAQGYSGAPTFCVEEIMSGLRIGGQRMKGGEKLHFIGILSRGLSDRSGGKISLIVPILYLWDILESDEFKKYEASLNI